MSKRARLFEHCVMYERFKKPGSDLHTIEQYQHWSPHRLSPVDLAALFVIHLHQRGIHSGQVFKIMGMDDQAEEIFFCDDIHALADQFLFQTIDPTKMFSTRQSGTPQGADPGTRAKRGEGRASRAGRNSR